MVAEKTLEKLDSVTANSLGWLEEFSKKGIEFIEKEAPELCNEVIKLGISKAIFMSVTSIILTVVCLVVLSKIYQFGKKHWEDNIDEAEGVLVVIGGLLSFTGSIVFTSMFFVNMYDCVAIWVAPRVYLINYFCDLAQKLK